MSEKKVFVPFAIALGAAVFVIGCSCEEPSKPDPTAAKPVEKPHAVERTAKPQMIQPTLVEELKNRIELPDDYPADGPRYPGAHAATTTRHKGKLSVMFSTTDSAEDVVAYTNDFLEKEGWINVTRADMDNGTFLRGDKDGTRVIAVLVSDLPDAPEEAGTLIAVAIDPS